ncbi:hypothetical protein HPB52_012161 [Rhipicephalus sanguineus]|uniref:Uncharacterized protein n=1 Tax=Rhipicephalus sanguineus TaxID=34632 RepID=A0A9D4T033_RHISA|nr:hypothetical protein HPB52_012161 [Rhipicephalus sanguineus]
MERQIDVTYVPLGGGDPVPYRVRVPKREKVRSLVEALTSQLEEPPPHGIALAELAHNGHMVQRILDEDMAVRCIGEGDREVFAFALGPWVEEEVKEDENVPKEECLPPGARAWHSEPDLDFHGESGQLQARASVPRGVQRVLENGPKYSYQPSATRSQLVAMVRDVASRASEPDRERAIADGVDCLLRTVSDKPGKKPPIKKIVKCLKEEGLAVVEADKEAIPKLSGAPALLAGAPSAFLCNLPVKAEAEFVPLSRMSSQRHRSRLVTVPLLFCLEGGQPWRAPTLLRVPCHCPASQLYTAAAAHLPPEACFTLSLVDAWGQRCSRCLPSRCGGCEVARVGWVSLQPGDCLALCCLDDDGPSRRDAWPRPATSGTARPSGSLSLYDCLQAFSESETLDEHNPWFCPVCQRNQRARKTLSIWRSPDTLMVYLKR